MQSWCHWIIVFQEITAAFCLGRCHPSHSCANHNPSSHQCHKECSLGIVRTTRQWQFHLDFLSSEGYFFFIDKVLKATWSRILEMEKLVGTRWPWIAVIIPWRRYFLSELPRGNLSKGAQKGREMQPKYMVSMQRMLKGTNIRIKSRISLVMPSTIDKD